MATKLMTIAGGLALSASSALAAPATGEYADFAHHGMMGWGGWAMGPLMMLIFFALLVGAVILIVRLVGGDTRNRTGPGDDRSIDILRERFAKGEIDAEEFAARKQALGG